MTIQTINTGSGPNSGDGDSIRSAFHKINNNFNQVVSTLSTNTILSSDRYNVAYYNNTGTTLAGSAFFNLDLATQRLHIGEESISGGINIIRNVPVLGFTEISSNIHIADYHNSVDVSNFQFFRARGSVNSPQSVHLNDEIAEIMFLAHNGTTATVAGAIGVVVAEQPTINGVSGKYIFRVSTGTNVLTTAAEISSSATWKINKLGHLSTTTSTIEVTGDMIPSLDLTYNLGSTSSQWRSLYVGTSTIYLGGTALSVAGGNLTIDGSPVSSSQTGNIRFVNDAIYDINGITLENADLSHGATAALILPGNGSTNAVELNNTYGNVSIGAGATGTVTNWIFGSDSTLNLPLAVNGKGVIQTTGDYYLNANGAIYNLGADGTLTLPSGMTFAPGMGDIITGSGNIHINNYTPTEPGFVAGSTIGMIDGQINLYVKSITTGTESRQWTFNALGVLEIPGSIQNSVNYNQLNMAQDAVVLSSENNSVTIVADNANTYRTWTFGADGKLTLPSGAYLRTDVYPGSVELTADPTSGGAGSYASLASSNGSSYIWVDNAGSYIATNWTATSHTWIFNKDGVMSTPGDIIPEADNVYDLGSPTRQWRHIYVNTGSIYLGNIKLTTQNNQLNIQQIDNIEGDEIIVQNVSINAVSINSQAPDGGNGGLWFNTVEGRMFVRYDNQWVDASPLVVPVPETELEVTSIEFNDASVQTTAWTGFVEWNNVTDKPAELAVIDGGNASTWLNPV